MSDGVNALTAREPSLGKVYMDLTGASECMARSVFMHVCCREDEDAKVADVNGTDALRQEEAAPGLVRPELRTGRRLGE